VSISPSKLAKCFFVLAKNYYKFCHKIYFGKNINNLTLPILFLTLFSNVSCAVLPVEYSKIKLANGLKLSAVSYRKIHNWQEDEHQLAIRAFLHSCNKFAKMPQKKIIDTNFLATAEDFRNVCDLAEAVKTMDKQESKAFFESYFVPFRVEEDGKNSLYNFTGYYYPEINGSLVKDKKFRFPIYRRPPGLKQNTKQPYFTREEIGKGALANQNLEILFVDDEVDLFFLHIQGSGRVKLADGSFVRLVFDGKNGHQYSSVGKYLFENNLMDSRSLDAKNIKKWLKENPKKSTDIMNVNKSFIFFKINEYEEVLGSQGVPLTPERSLAIDKSLIAFGLPIWINTTIVDFDQDNNRFSKTYRRLLIAQDSGSAIKGAVRGDIFFGSGTLAENRASYLSAKGSYYLLLPITIANKLIKASSRSIL
jgi:membrane-bound lytic murein transglycosylase A